MVRGVGCMYGVRKRYGLGFFWLRRGQLGKGRKVRIERGHR